MIEGYQEKLRFGYYGTLLFFPFSIIVAMMHWETQEDATCYMKRNHATYAILVGYSIFVIFSAIMYLVLFVAPLWHIWGRADTTRKNKIVTKTMLICVWCAVSVFGIFAFILELIPGVLAAGIQAIMSMLCIVLQFKQPCTIFNSQE